MRIKKIFLCVLFVSVNSYAASFNCDKARTKDEILICSDIELSELDSQMAVMYRDAVKGAPNGGKILRFEQQRWLKESRISTPTETDSVRIKELKTSYIYHIEALKEALDDRNFVASDEVFIKFTSLKTIKCDDAIKFSSVGRVDSSQDAVGLYKLFYDGSSTVRLGYDADIDFDKGDAIQNLMENRVFVKMNATICPKAKDQNGVNYLQAESQVEFFKRKFD